ncbi:MAG: hypothetical protein COT81_00905 [Candidatus Buchananbacteria bacterium CG10_big_fil_rev_8_21_14_0_10_42_9]|uniref:Uncharacterized protein n=1 Tax=Candidatus Buchananbacteria bacterium CG10_big_fil_rev_8_21_14_0_10_42_9 TaxID=1974526 RepID=A0A2H0W4H9_9BACT|nr:MAG: hypothetical protein COT81_00905 [Candidatus Buchananbacteria bacterium CG10_big_fil_rev_8_21_14_0_10_42_9]
MLENTLNILTVLGFTLSTIGKLIVAYTAYAIHVKISKMKKIDDLVLETMKHEKALAIMGILFMVLGYFLELPEKFL